jgi:hypothetical protein
MQKSVVLGKSKASTTITDGRSSMPRPGGDRVQLGLMIEPKLCLFLSFFLSAQRERQPATRKGGLTIEQHGTYE